jgi:DNA-binding transcriptional ArsR family regulator
MTAPPRSARKDTLRSDARLTPELQELMARAGDASAFLRAIGHQSRLLLLCLIAERERSVTELEAILWLPQANVSQRLARLRRDRLVETRRDGRAVFYRLASEDVRQVIAVLYEVFCKGERRNRNV